MIAHICDRCCRPLEEGTQRYIARIEVFAAADPLVISEEELRRDRRQEVQTAMDKCAEMSEEELMRDVYVEFKFTLCRPCQRAYIGDPLPMIHAGGNE